MRTRGSCEIHEEKWRKYQMSNQHLGVSQLLGVTPNCWPTNFFLHFSSQALHEPLLRTMEKIHFSCFSNVFHCFGSCVHWSKYTTPSCFCLLLKIGIFLVIPCERSKYWGGQFNWKKKSAPVYGVKEFVCLSVCLSVCKISSPTLKNEWRNIPFFLLYLQKLRSWVNGDRGDEGTNGCKYCFKDWQ